MTQKHQLQNQGLKTLDAFISKLEDKESSLIKVLYQAQHIFGYLPRDVLFFIARVQLQSATPAV